MLWCPILPERRPKFEMIMRALEAGWPGAKCCYGMPPDDDNPVVAYGQIWGSEKILRQAFQRGRPFWHIDNGYFRPGRGRLDGYYRMCWCGMSPVYLPAAVPERGAALGIKMKDWRKNGRHVLVGLPGAEYGCGIGLDMGSWIAWIKSELPNHTERPIILRDRKSAIPLEHHLKDCWAVVTHSSNIAVDAVVAGIPVFVMPGSSAAPVGNLNLVCLEAPAMPERTRWFNSLACQQFTPTEMRDGTCYEWMQVVADLTV